MRRTILKIEKQDGEPLEIEVNGKRLVGAFERGLIYGAVALLGLGTLWVTVTVVLPLVGVVLGLFVSIVGVAVTVAAILLLLALIWVVVSTLLDRSSGRRRERDDWDE